VELGESYARTDWSRRPLPEAATSYALDDVRHLLAAWDKVDADLRGLGRREWLDEECARALAVPLEADTLAVWARLKGMQSLPLPAQCAGLALVRWRETAAQRADRPRRWLLADEQLFAIAATLPPNADELGEIVPPKLVARFGAAVLEALTQRDEPALIAEVRANGAPQVIENSGIKGLQEQARERAAQLNIEPEILATRRDLIALASGTPPKHLTSGWRAPIFASLLPKPVP